MASSSSSLSRTIPLFSDHPLPTFSLYPLCPHHPLPTFPPRVDPSYFMDAKVKVWWDTYTAPFPSDADPYNLIDNILNSLNNAGYRPNKIVFWGRMTRNLDPDLSMKLETAILLGCAKGIVYPSRLCCGWSDCPDDDDRVSRCILMDMFRSERRLTYPVNHLLISGHEMFNRPLSVLKARGHNILIARPPTASEVFDSNIATTVWNWNDLAQGREPLHSTLPFVPNQEYGSNVDHLASRSYVDYPGPSGNKAEEPYTFRQPFSNPELGSYCAPGPCSSAAYSFSHPFIPNQEFQSDNELE